MNAVEAVVAALVVVLVLALLIVVIDPIGAPAGCASGTVLVTQYVSERNGVGSGIALGGKNPQPVVVFTHESAKWIVVVQTEDGEEEIKTTAAVSSALKPGDRVTYAFVRGWITGVKQKYSIRDDCQGAE